MPLRTLLRMLCWRSSGADQSFKRTICQKNLRMKKRRLSSIRLLVHSESAWQKRYIFFLLRFSDSLCSNRYIVTVARKTIARKIRAFFNQFAESNGTAVYPERINTMCAANKCSLEVSFMHLAQWNPMLAAWLAEAPAEMVATKKKEKKKEKKAKRHKDTKPKKG